MAKQKIKKEKEVKPIAEETVTNDVQPIEDILKEDIGYTEITEEIKHVVTEEDLEINPELVDSGVEVGDIISFSKEDELTQEEYENEFKLAVRNFIDATQGVYLGGYATQCRNNVIEFL